ncbi:hypothetical protein FFY45_00110 [Xanthomonas hortorum]|nr:hypothetical protein [Xanthomonas hortorum]
MTGFSLRGWLSRSGPSPTHVSSEWAAFRRTLTLTPAPRPGPRLRRGRTRAHAPVARKPCPGAPAGEGLSLPSPIGRRWRVAPDEDTGARAAPAQASLCTRADQSIPTQLQP